MRLSWFLPFAVLLPLHLHAMQNTVTGRVATVVISPNAVTVLHLRPEFESSIRMPEEITSVILGSPGSFKAEHSEGEPDYVYVKPTTKEPAQSNLLVATKSGQHVTLELVSEGSGSAGTQAVDFLLTYRGTQSFLVQPHNADPEKRTTPASSPAAHSTLPSVAPSAIELEFEQQKLINSPKWTKWNGKQIETSIGDVRQLGNRTAVSYSVYNSAATAVEIVPPQIQISGRQIKKKKKKKEGKGLISDQLEIRDYRLSATRLDAGGRADGVVLFDRPNFKQASEKLFLQLAQADQVDQPVLIAVPFTPPVAASGN